MTMNASPALPVGGLVEAVHSALESRRLPAGQAFRQALTQAQGVPARAGPKHQGKMIDGREDQGDPGQVQALALDSKPSEQPKALVHRGAASSTAEVEDGSRDQPSRTMSASSSTSLEGRAGDGFATRARHTADLVSNSPVNGFSGRLDHAQAHVAASPAGVAMQFLDPSWVVSGIDVSILADGAVDVVLNVDRTAQTAISGELEQLKRRLEAKGISVAAVQLATKPLSLPAEDADA
jgi:hypothetical protein